MIQFFEVYWFQIDLLEAYFIKENEKNEQKLHFDLYLPIEFKPSSGSSLVGYLLREKQSKNPVEVFGVTMNCLFNHLI